MYTSIQELRDEADELQQTMDECEKSGDTRQLERLQQQLQQTQSKLLEKNEQRHLARWAPVVLRCFDTAGRVLRAARSVAMFRLHDITSKGPD